MKIFQGPSPELTQVQLLSKGLVDSGYRVHLCEGGDFQKIMDNFERKKEKYHIFHFHSGISFTDGKREFRYARNKKKIRLIHFWGDDVRREEIAVIRNPYARLIERYLPKHTIRDRLRVQSRYIPACIVPNFEVMPYVIPYFKRVYILPVAVDLKKICVAKKQDQEKLIFYVSRKSQQEDEFVEYTVTKLKENGLNFNFVVSTDVPQLNHFDMYKKADIVIDQILYGCYSVHAVEAMAHGKPVVSYIREDLKPRFVNKLPIVSANPSTLYQELHNLLLDWELCAKLGFIGRNYVKQNHELSVVIKQLQWIYKREEQLVQDNKNIKKEVISFMKRNINLYQVSQEDELVSINPTKIGRL